MSLIERVKEWKLRELNREYLLINESEGIIQYKKLKDITEKDEKNNLIYERVKDIKILQDNYKV